MIFYEFLQLPAEARVFEKNIFDWIVSGEFSTKIGFRIDALSIIMCLVVTGVGFLIHVYSAGYMHDDPGFARYFTYLNLFVFMMLILVTANNLLLMFVGWEGVGLCSYLLIGFWYEKDSAAECREEGLHRQPDRRLRLPPRASSFSSSTLGAKGVWTLNYAEIQAERPSARPAPRHRHHPLSSSSAPRESRPRYPCTCGCPTPWKVRRRSAP